MEFSAYILTRQVVNIFEWVFAWRGNKRQLRLQLRKAKTYEEWIKIAKELDQYMGFDDWKENGDDGYFDYTLVCHYKSPCDIAPDDIGQTSQEDSEQDEGCKGYQGTHGHFGRMCEEQFRRYRVLQNVQRGRSMSHSMISQADSSHSTVPSTWWKLISER
jgi:hypothetical protein